MAGYTDSELPQDIDSTYADTGDASVAVHQRHHDRLHLIGRLFDKDASPSDGQVLAWDSGSSVYVPTTPASGTSPLAPYAALVYKSGATFYYKDRDGVVQASGTNARTVINSAITAVAATSNQTGGGTVFVAAGVYPIDSTSVVLKKGVKLMGEGWSGATADSTYEQYGTVFTSSVAYPVIKANVADGAYGCRVDNVSIDGNGVATAGVQADSADFRLTNFFIHDINGNGVDINDSASYYRIKIMDGLITSSLRGIDVTGPTDGLIQNVVCRSSTNYSIYIAGGGWQVIGCHLTTVVGSCTNLYLGSTPGGMVVGNYFDMFRGYNIDIGSGGNRACISGNYLLYANNANPIIRVQGANGVSIMNNTFYGGSNSANFVKFSSAPSGAKIIGNTGTGITSYSVSSSTSTDWSELGASGTNYCIGNTAW